MESEGPPATATWPPAAAAAADRNIGLHAVQDSAPTQASFTQLQGDRHPDIRHLSYVFLEKIRERFGDPSPILTGIHEVLGDFAAGHASKRHTYFVILAAICHDEDLKRDLAALLHHEGARWSPRDFEPEQTNSFPHTIPDDLQPHNRSSNPVPQFPNIVDRSAMIQEVKDFGSAIDPNLSQHAYNQSVHTNGHRNNGGYSSNGGYESDGQHSLAPGTYVYPAPHSPMRASHYAYPDQGDSGELAHDYGYNIQSAGNDRQTPLSPRSYVQPPLQPPVPQAQLQVHALGQPTTPAMLTPQAPTFETYSGVGRLSVPISPKTKLDGPFGAYRSLSYDGGWCAGQNDTFSHHDPFGQDLPYRRATGSSEMAYESKKQLTPFDPEGHTESGYAVATPIAAPAGGPPLDVPEDTPSYPHHTPAPLQMPSPEEVNEANVRTESSTEPLPPTPNNKSDSGALRASGNFIHSLCGKAFTTRSGVKKHHWGGKLNNLKTTTGCWAKHGKPDVSWDDHPSCKVRVKTEEQPQDRRRVHTPKPAVAQMTSGHQGAVDMPTLNELPQRIAEAPTDPLPPPRRAFRYGNAPGSYGSGPGPDDYGNFQTLLTAVNVASSIESPTPQSRNDSVITHLDAQASAAESASGAPPPPWGHVRHQNVGLDAQAHLPDGIHVQDQQYISNAGHEFRPHVLQYSPHASAAHAFAEPAHPYAESGHVETGHTPKRGRPRLDYGNQGQAVSDTSPRPEPKKQRVGGSETLRDDATAVSAYEQNGH